MTSSATLIQQTARSQVVLLKIPHAQQRLPAPYRRKQTPIAQMMIALMTLVGFLLVLIIAQFSVEVMMMMILQHQLNVVFVEEGRMMSLALLQRKMMPTDIQKLFV
jgi:hypothetical protein